MMVMYSVSRARPTLALEFDSSEHQCNAVYTKLGPSTHPQAPLKAEGYQEFNVNAHADINTCSKMPCFFFVRERKIERAVDSSSMRNFLGYVAVKSYTVVVNVLVYI